MVTGSPAMDHHSERNGTVRAFLLSVDALNGISAVIPVVRCERLRDR